MRRLIFDLDGTLLDISKKYYLSHFIACKKVNISPLLESNYWKYKRKKVPEYKILKLTKNSRIFKQYENWRLSYLEDPKILKNDKLFPNLLKLLKELKKNNLLYLITLRRNKKNLFTQLKNLKIINLFEKILTSPPKKNPLLTKVKLSKKIKAVFNPDDIIIGDTEVEIQLAKKLKVKSVALASGIRSIDILKKFKPDYIFKNISVFLKDFLKEYEKSKNNNDNARIQ